jgi:branched-chain amino acid aminotransferase
MPDKIHWICYNGRFTEENSSGFPALNRAFRLGDGFFESIRLIEGRPHLWGAHFSRILACAKALNMEVPGHFTSDFFQEKIAVLTERNQFQSGARLRITFFREGEGTYAPKSLRMGFLMEMSPFANNGFHVKEEGIHLGLYTTLSKHIDPLSKFKLLGGHVYIQASIWAEANGYDDALIINDKGYIIEGTASNLFVVRDGELHTPAVHQGCIGGVMRMSVINEAIRQGIPCFESQLDVEDLLRADEVFLSNAVKGLMWVRSFRDKRYYHKMSDKLIAGINTSYTMSLASIDT